MPRPRLPIRRLPLPRISFKRNRHRAAPTDRDKFLFAVKVAAVVVLTGIVTGVVLLATNSDGGGDDDVAVTNPPVPTITDGGSESTEPAPDVPPPTASVAAPAVGTQTAVLTPSKPTSTSRRAPETPPGRDPQVARLRQPCAPEGSLGFTRKFEPLVCQNGRWDRVF